MITSEKKSEYNKRFYEKNKEYYKEYMMKRVICECGCEIYVGNKFKHIQTKKHFNLINQNMQERLNNSIIE